MKRKTLFGLLLAGVIGVVAIAFYQYNKPHKNIQESKPIANYTATDLFDAFETNEAELTQKYTGQILEVTGNVYSVEALDAERSHVLLMEEDAMFGISCSFDLPIANLSVNKSDQITVKGECAGMTSDVVLIRCVLVND
jgi:hypothetical protein